MPKKRDHKTGSIVARKNGLSARVMVGYKKNKQGRTIPHRVSVHANSKTELNRKVIAVQKEHQEKINPPPRVLTVKELCLLWEAEKKKSGAETSTTDNYSSLVTHHILPAFGDKPLNELDSASIQNTLYAKTVNGRVDGKGGLSSATVNLIHAILIMLLSFAVEQGYLETNPMRRQRVRKIRTRRRQIRIMSDEHIVRLLDSTDDMRIKALFSFLLATGTRRGEALGLKWQEVNQSEQEVWIKQGLKKDKKEKAKLGRLKRDNTERTIPLHPDDFAALMEWKGIQEEEKKLAGKEYDDQDFVFCNADGSRMYPDSVNWWLEKGCKKAQISKYTPHEFRHTFASRMIRSGAHPKVLQELLGHSTIKMTMDTYGHLFPGMKRDAILQAPSINRLRSPAAPAATTPTAPEGPESSAKPEPNTPDAPESPEPPAKQ